MLRSASVGLILNMMIWVPSSQRFELTVPLTLMRCLLVAGSAGVIKLTKVVFLDRDGTLNVDHGYVHRREDWQFIDGAVNAIDMLHGSGYRVAIVTNQSGVGRGMFTIQHVEDLHAYMKAELAAEGTYVDCIAYCPHAPDDNCACRKPRPGLAQRIASLLPGEIDYSSSWTIGDKASDVEFGANLGTRTGFV